MQIEEIIRGCKNAEAACQKALFVAFAPKVMTVCRRYANNYAAAEDLLQEAFIKVFHHIDQYDTSRGNIEAWIKRIAINLAISQWRKEHKQEWSKIDVESLQIASSMSADHNLHEEDLLALIDQLPPGYKVVFNLFAIEGYTHLEIANELGITESTSRSQLTHARRFLRDLFQDQQQQIAYE
jgi:RNA polymerase sigma factor (sigma-70 family)